MTYTVAYQDNLVTLYHGDARKVVSDLDDASIDLVLTDPPYGHENNQNDLIANWEKATPKAGMLSSKRRWEWITGRITKDELDKTYAPRPILSDDEESANELVRWFFDASSRILKPGCCCCCCAGGGGPNPQFARWSLWLDELLGFKHMVVWDKGGLGMGWHYRRNYEVILIGEKPGAPTKWYGGLTTSNVIRINKIIPRKDQHPTEKPAELMARFIRLHTAPGDLVLDPFAGGGATLIAARLLGRRAIGVELDPQFVALAVGRLKQATLPLHEPQEDTASQESLFDE